MIGFSIMHKHIYIVAFLIFRVFEGLTRRNSHACTVGGVGSVSTRGMRLLTETSPTPSGHTPTESVGKTRAGMARRVSRLGWLGWVSPRGSAARRGGDTGRGGRGGRHSVGAGVSLPRVGGR